MAAHSRLPVVGVIGSAEKDFAERTAPIGSWLAGLGVHLLTGAGTGVMRSVSEAFYRTPNRKGLVLGIVPCAKNTPTVPKKDYPNEWVEIPIYTHLDKSGPEGEAPQSRNHIVALTANVLIAFPGGHGTASEVRLARRYQRPVIAYLQAPNELPDFPEDVPIEPNLERVKAFVTEALARAR